MSSKKTLVFWILVGIQALVVLAMVALHQSVILYGKTIVLKTQPVDPHSIFRGDYARLSFEINRPEVGISLNPKNGDRVYAELAPQATSWYAVSFQEKIPVDLPQNHVILRGRVLSTYEWKEQIVFDIVDFSTPGWLDTQPATATWRQRQDPSGRQTRGVKYSGKELLEGTTVYIQLVFNNNYRLDWYWDITKMTENTNELGIPDHRYPTIILAGRVGPYKQKRLLNIEYGIESYFIPEGKGRKYEQPELDVEIAVNRRGRAVVKKVILPPGQK